MAQAGDVGWTLQNPGGVQDAVIKHRADYGISLDGDGDRVILVDKEGNILDGDDLLYILAFANPNRTGAWSGVVGTLMSNLGLEDGIQKLGYKFIRADVGDKYVTEMLTKKGWMLGGEASGHIICKDLVSTGDGTIAALKVISSLLMLEKSPQEVLSNYKKVPQINKAVPVNNKDIVNDKDLKVLIKEIESDMTVGRVLVRPSGTESKIRIMVESPEKNVAEKYAKDIQFTAAKTIPEFLTDKDLASGRIFPKLDKIRDISLAIAKNIVIENSDGKLEDYTSIENQIESRMYKAKYKKLD